MIRQSTLVQTMAWCQAITWAKVDPDLCCHMELLGHNDLTLICCSLLENTEMHLLFISFFQNRYGAGSWNPSFWKTRTALSYFVKTMADAESPGHQQPWYWLHSVHDDVITWKHFPRYWPFVRGIHQSPVNSPHKGQWRGALMFSLICVWITIEKTIVRLVI